MYSVNCKTGKKTKAFSSPILPMGACGQYLYGMTPKPGSGHEPAYIWKISGNKLKKAGRLDAGMDPDGLRVVNKKLYFASYKGSGRDNMTVYQSALNGKGRKKLFNITEPNSTIYLMDVDKSSITAFVHTAKGSLQYVYDIKTGKLTKTS